MGRRVVRGRVAQAPLAPRRLLLPALMTACMVALTLWLGVWQIHRLAWKTALLAEIDAGEAAAPVPLRPDPLPFSKVEASGHLRADLAVRYGSDVRGDALGSQVIEPLERPGADPLMVELGWLPDGAAPPTAGDAAIVGYVRPPDSPARFGVGDDPARRRFYTLNPAAIAAALGLPQVAPFTLVALGPPDRLPQPAQALPRPPNNHLSYAITWFGLAAASLGVFAAYAVKVLRP